jgi:hypothetical protein
MTVPFWTPTGSAVGGKQGWRCARTSTFTCYQKKRSGERSTCLPKGTGKPDNRFVTSSVEQAREGHNAQTLPCSLNLDGAVPGRGPDIFTPIRTNLSKDEAKSSSICDDIKDHRDIISRRSLRHDECITGGTFPEAHPRRAGRCARS